MNTLRYRQFALSSALLLMGKMRTWEYLTCIICVNSLLFVTSNFDYWELPIPVPKKKGKKILIRHDAKSKCKLEKKIVTNGLDQFSAISFYSFPMSFQSAYLLQAIHPCWYPFSYTYNFHYCNPSNWQLLNAIRRIKMNAIHKQTVLT